MTISSVNAKPGNNDYPIHEKPSEATNTNEPCQYIWGRSKKTDNLNAELNSIIGNDGVSNYDEALALAAFCVNIKLSYNCGSTEYKKCDIEMVARMVEEARREFCNGGSKPNLGI